MEDKLELISLKGGGRAEVVRLMLTFAGKKFMDLQLTIPAWRLRKKRDNFHEDTRLPVLIANDRTQYVGVNEISRYVASKLALYGTNSEEQKLIDEIIDVLDDLHAGLAPVVRASLTKNFEGKQEAWNDFKTNLLFPRLAEFQEKLSGKMFLVGSRISWADIALIETLTRFQSCYDSFYLAHFPVLKEYCDRFETLPNMRSYIQTRPDLQF